MSPAQSSSSQTSRRISRRRGSAIACTASMAVILVGASSCVPGGCHFSLDLINDPECTTRSPAMKTAMTEFATLFARTAEAIPSDRLTAATPCARFTVADLLAHIGGVLPDSERAAAKRPRTGAPAALTDPTAVAAVAERAAAAWQAPEALTGETEFGPNTVPATLAAAVTLQELALHGWDLARATGRPFPVGEEAAAVLLGVVEQLADQARANGGYGPALTAPGGAPAFERALALSGRNPDWAD
ncbi:TIGR03086 family protein [Streptomyces sp. CB01881]|nr:TIGR03086 family protein [Streptomyces sp. CB01881]